MAAVPSSDPLRPFVITITILLVVAAMYLARVVVVPVVVSALLAFLLTPLVTRLQRWRVPRVAAAVLIAALAFAFVGALLVIVGAQLKSLTTELPKHRDEIHAKAESIHQLLSHDGTSNLTDVIDETLQTIIPPADNSSGVAPTPVTAAMPTATSLWNTIMEWVAAPSLEILIGTGVVLVLVVFMLAQHEDLRNRIIRLSGTRNVTSTTKALGDATRRVRRFLFHQFLINCCFGLTVAAGLWAIGVPYPWLWGVLGAALRYIPYVGTWLAAVCPVLLSIAFTEGWTHPLLTLSLFVVLDVGVTNILEPIVYGRSVGVSGPALLIAAVFWAWLWGPIGLILSTPLTACVVVLGRHVANLEFLSVLLGDEPALSPSLRLYQRLLARDEDEATNLVDEFMQKHGVEKVYDHMLVPALVHAKESLDRGAMTPEDKERILNATGQLLEHTVFPEHEAVHAKEASSAKPGITRELLVLGCPWRDAMDESALRMLQRLLAAENCQLEVQSPEALAGEVVARVGEVQPVAVVIGALAPYSFAAVRYLCKRLRHQLPGVKILVGCWGLREDVQQAIDALKSAGADLASTDLLETRDLLLPLMRDAATTRAAQQTKPAERVGA